MALLSSRKISFLHH